MDGDDSTNFKYSGLYEKVDQFAIKFQKSPARNAEGRAERLLKGDDKDLAVKLLERLILPSSCLSPEKIHAELHPSCFGIAKGQETVGSERARGATMRLQHQGYDSKDFFYE